VNGIPSNFPYDKDRFKEKVISFDDDPHFQLPSGQLIECFEFIDSAPTLVVCTAGRSRSAAVCIAYLIKRKGLNFKTAFDIKHSKTFN